MPLVAPQPIVSQRLVVRLAREDDLPALLEVHRDDEVTALLPFATWTSMDDACTWLRRMQGLQASGIALQFVIVDKSTNRAIGTSLLFRYEEGSQRAELGYVLGRPHWGRGLVHEALTALLDTAFGSMGLRRIEAEVDTRNDRSAAVLRRLGFTAQALLRQRWVAKGSPKDTRIFGLLRPEWTAGR